MASSVTFVIYVICLSFVVFYGLGTHTSQKVSQERATVVYFDPKYIRKAQAFTFRARRGDPYRSNFTAELLHSWGNNVTVVVSYTGKYNGNVVLVKGRICDLFKVNWLGDFIAKYMHTEFKCPMQPGVYGFYNLELPPKDFPVPLPKGEGTIFFTYYLEGKKKMLQAAVIVNSAN